MSGLMKNNDGLPEGWEIKPIGEACQFEKGKKPKNTGNRSDARTIPYINIKAFESGVPEEYAEQGNYPICSKDDVLIVWDGARSGLVGKGVSGYIGSTLSKVWSESTDDNYLFYFLKSQYGYVNTNTKGVGIPHVDPNILYAIQVAIAPYNEQKLIVSEIEKQFSRLDEAVAALKRVRASLKRYKASVLKAAVEGKLTEEWRKENPNVESADKLLKRILAERKKKWEEKNPKKKYKEPPAPDTSTLPDLPNGWVWATVGQISETNPSIDKKSIPDDLLVSFVPMAEVGAENGHINVNNTCPFSEVKKGFTNFLEGDVLFAKITPCMENGKMAIVPALSNGYGFGSTEFHVIRPYDSVNPYFIYYMVSNLSYRKEAAHHMTGAVGQKRVPESFLVNTCMPLPHLEEQLQIISDVQRRRSEEHTSELQS